MAQAAPIRRNILLIEPDPLFRLPRVAALRGAGYEVTAPRSGAAGLRVLCERSFDLVLLGDTFEDTSRTDLCRKIKTQHPRLPVVLLVGLSANPEVWADWFVDTKSGKSGLVAGVDHALHMQNREI